MKIFKKIAVYFSAIILMFTVATVALAAEGSVDWGNGVIRVKGNGVGKAAYKESSPGQYRLTARQAARMDAQRKLAEYAEGVMVTGNASVHDFALEDDRVATMLKGVLLKNAVEIGEPRYTDDGICEVTMELRLFGGKGSLAEVAFLPFKDEKTIPFPAPEDKTVIKQSTVVNQNYTGLIVDCSGMNITCVMSPVIFNDKGTTIYGHKYLSVEQVIRDGMASYAESVDDETSRTRAGNNPLIVKALSLDDLNANPVISMADSDKILAANQHDKFLDNCAVVFVK